MKTGYKQKIEQALKERSLSNGIGAVLSDGSTIMSYLTRKGYYVDEGILYPTYDYVVIGKSRFSVESLEQAMVGLNPTGIVIVVIDGEAVVLTQRSN